MTFTMYRLTEWMAVIESVFDHKGNRCARTRSNPAVHLDARVGRAGAVRTASADRQKSCQLSTTSPYASDQRYNVICSLSGAAGPVARHSWLGIDGSYSMAKPSPDFAFAATGCAWISLRALNAPK